jgi:trans-aconitate methyltransferase
MNLYNKETSFNFYEDRYTAGYMDDWDIEKKQRVSEIIKGLDLPTSGNALDFGCGTGVFTQVIKQELPDWNVYGTDISTTAIDKASKKNTDCIFFTILDKTYNNIKFDFLYSHHVLEHVYDLTASIEDMNSFMKPSSSCLHILPCGNEGSFEHKICSLMKNGINEKMENRFFYEEPGHIRRLTTEQLNTIMGKYGFKLAKEYYSHQYYGSISWMITEGDTKFILSLTDPLMAKDLKSARKLLLLRKCLLLLSFFRKTVMTAKSLEIKGTRLRHKVKSSAVLLLYPLSSLVYKYLARKAQQEWKCRKTDRSGSEMYLYYKR